MIFNNEIKLINRTKRGDKKAANELISNYYKEIYGFVYKQILNKDTAMDLTQEIFISVLKSISNYNSNKASFKTWIYKISTYKIIDYFRSKSYKQQQISLSIDNVDLTDEKDLSLALEKSDTANQILNLISDFDLQSQQILRMKIFSEYTFLEISKVLNLSESTIKTKYYSLIKKIRKEMEDKNES